MNNLADTCLVLIVLCNLSILSAGRLSHLVRALAAEGVLLAVLLVPQALGGEYHMLWIAAGTLLVKGVAMPMLFMRALRSIDEPLDAKPIVGYMISLVVGFGILVSAFVVGLATPSRVHSGNVLMGAVGLSTLFCGIFIMVNRRKALAEVIGFLVMENGILLLSRHITPGLPWVIEFAILFDILVAAMIFGGFVQTMHSLFLHTDVSRMRKLRG